MQIEDFQKVATLLSPELKLDQTQASLLQEIINRLNQMEQRILIFGSAGVGKSTIAKLITYYLNHTYKHSKILYLTYHLANLHKTMDDLSSLSSLSLNSCDDIPTNQGVYCTTFHRLQRKFEHHPALLQQLRMQFDFVICDEYQDYDTEKIKKIIRFISGGSILFTDPSQVIRGEQSINMKYPYAILSTSNLVLFNEDDLATASPRQLSYIEQQVKNSKEPYFNKIEELIHDQPPGEHLVETRKPDETFSSNEMISRIKKVMVNLRKDLISNEDTANYIEFEVVKNILYVLDEHADGQLESIREKLSLVFGADIWNDAGLLSEDSKTMLVTAEVIYNDLCKHRAYHSLDFSAAIIPLTKAFEREIYHHFYVSLQEFCSEYLGPFNSRWPAPLIYPNPYQHPEGVFTANTIHFTLGSVQKMVYDKNFKAIRDEFLKQYFKGDLRLNELVSDIQVIKTNYRDKVAHKDGISITDAKQCRADMIEIKKIFINFLRSVKVPSGY